jgi:eukaryotic-like serine/threonine-protein kinase
MASDDGPPPPRPGDGAHGPATAPGEQGTLVGRYVLLDVLGEGGTGVVHRAWDPELDRHIALKLVQPRRDDALPDARARIVREARLMARLDHPNVVRIHDVGQTDERIYLAMELVQGSTLRQFLQARRRPLAEVLAVLGAAGQGLAAAHDAGLVHRDFKPDNVLVGDDGGVRVADFGLAQLVAPEPVRASTQRVPLADGDALASLTRSGTLVGTPAYMAPEQLFGDPVDARSDQFAFCVVLWEAVLGARPFAAESLEALASAIMRQQLEPPPPGRRMPGWLRRTLVRGLAPDPRARHASMHALLAALEAAPRRRRVLRAAVVGLGLATVITGALAIADPGRRCAIDTLPRTDPGQRAALVAAVQATGPGGAARARQLERILDERARAWLDAREAVCAGGAWPRSPAVAGTTAPIECLARTRLRLERLEQQLLAGDEAAVDGLLAAALAAPSPHTCVAIASPDDVEPAHAAVVEAELALARGRLDEAAEQLQAAGGVDEPAGRIAAGALAWRRGETIAAAEAFHAAAAAAETAGLERQAAHAWVHVVELAAAVDPTAASRQAPLARAAVDRVGDESGLGLRLELALRTDPASSATAGLAAAMRALARTHGDDDPRLAAGHHAWAAHHRAAGRPADAVAAELRAIAITQAAYGRDDPRLVPLLQRLAEALAQAGASAEAATHRARAEVLAQARDSPAGGPP